MNPTDLEVLPQPTSTQTTEHAVGDACRRIAPLWPLESFVAVNPYLGLADHAFGKAAQRLAITAGAHTTMPASYYLDAVHEGRITDGDLDFALHASGLAPGLDVAALLRAVENGSNSHGSAARRVPTVAAVATTATDHDWVRFSTDRISAWAAAYFDRGQASWRSTDQTAALFASWKEEASIDRTPEIMGLKGFRAVVRSQSDDPHQVVHDALVALGIPSAARELYLHALLQRVGGWASYAARVVWDSQLLDQADDTLVEFLAVLLSWEVGILRCLTGEGVASAWLDAVPSLDELSLLLDAGYSTDASLRYRLVFQEAFDRSEQRRIVELLSTPTSAPASDPARPRAQAVFCIDVRSEVLRRHLEAVAEDVATIGFAGFFGFAIEYVPLAHDQGEAQCPVLLRPGYTVVEELPDAHSTGAAVQARHLDHMVRRSWKSFKMGAISCFSFVGPVGLLYLPKLFTDGFGSTRPVRRPEDEGISKWAVEHKAPGLAPEALPSRTVGIPVAARIDLAEGALRGMSLTEGFAPVVLIIGHGASTVNNPYDTGLDCGACGGHTGEANARVAATILNDDVVRAGLVERGIRIPADTWFVAGQHNTTTDDIELFDGAQVPNDHVHLLADLRADLVAAGQHSRAERARRLGLPGSATIDTKMIDKAVRGRSTDWAQVRPEWGLAGCRAFIAAPRSRTEGRDLGGWSFLHSYDWRQDEGFGVLQLIMTAPMVVASWISLQYYASTVDNELFGSGNKTLHNVVGRMGVLEGNAGDLRSGLPWQSVHDGEKLQHEPLRLNVFIEAPIEAMNDVLAANPSVRDLCDNGWLHLLAIGDSGSPTHRYVGDLAWEPIQPSS